MQVDVRKDCRRSRCRFQHDPTFVVRLQNFATTNGRRGRAHRPAPICDAQVDDPHVAVH